MKTIISALALVIAVPAAAQTAAPAQQAHQHHQGMDHSQHKGMDHSKHQGMDHSKHQMDCCKDGKHKECCEKAMKDGKKMPCCEDKPDAKIGAAPAADSGHAGHDH